MRCLPNRAIRTMVGILFLLIGETRGQAPTIPSVLRPGTSGDGSTHGESPGALSGLAGPTGQGEILGGRPGPSVPRVPTSITRPDRRGATPTPGQVSSPSALPLAELPVFGPLSVPAEGEDEGPADGLTLDEAIERLIRENLALKARALELPLAEADVLTAGLRANPLI